MIWKVSAKGRVLCITRALTYDQAFAISFAEAERRGVTVPSGVAVLRPATIAAPPHRDRPKLQLFVQDADTRHWRKNDGYVDGETLKAYIEGEALELTEYHWPGPDDAPDAPVLTSPELLAAIERVAAEEPLSAEQQTAIADMYKLYRERRDSTA
jgi:hypothetical protein